MPSSENKFFDPLPELTAIKEYLATRWDNLPADFWTVLTFIGNVASRDGLRHVDNHLVWEVMHARTEAREALLEGKLPFAGAVYYDRPLCVMSALMDANREFSHALRDQNGEWSHGDRAATLLTEIISFCPEFTQVRPKGWDAMRDGYSDFDGQEEYCQSAQFETDQREFRGAAIASLTGGGFVYRTALPYVMYDDVAQSRAPDYVLVAAVYAQLVNCCKQFNDKALVAAAKALPLMDDTPELVLMMDRPETDNLHLRGMFAYLEGFRRSVFVPAEQAQADWDQALASQVAWAALPDEERAAQIKKNQQSMLDSIDEIVKESREESSDSAKAQARAKADADAMTQFITRLKEQVPELVAPGI